MHDYGIICEKYGINFMISKNFIRQQNINKMKKYTKIFAPSRHYKLISTLYKLINLKKPKNILLFMPLSYEPNVYRLRRKLANKHSIFVPFMVGLSLKMVKLRQPFNIKKFNVKEPVNQQFANFKIDMAIVPVVGVDKDMARIGHAKGYYDRFFSSLPYRVSDVVFVQILDMFIDFKISQPHDLVGDYYLTTKKNYVKRGKNDRDFSRIRSRCGVHWCRVCSS